MYQKENDMSKRSLVVVLTRNVQGATGITSIPKANRMCQKGTSISKIPSIEVLKEHIGDSISTTVIPKVTRTSSAPKQKNIYNKKTDIFNMCRVCLTQNPKAMYDLTDIIKDFTESCSREISIIEALQTVTSTTIIIHPKYPQYICPVCLSILKLAYKFILDFKKSLMKLETAEGLGDDIGKQRIMGMNIEETENNWKSNTIELLTEEDYMDIEESEQVEINSNPLCKLDRGITNSLQQKSEISKLDKLGMKHKMKDGIDSELIVRVEGEESDDNWKSGKVELIIVEEDVDISNNCQKDECEVKFDGLLSELGITGGQYGRQNLHKDNPLDKMFSCERCGRSFGSKERLKEHMSFHLVKKKILCSLCGERFYQQNGLTRHLVLHKYGRRYQCPYCAKLFSMESTLQVHERIHTGEVQFQCKFCDERFSSKRERSVHENVHTGFNPYVCRFCHQGFTKPNDLKLHLFQHGGLYSCNICDSNFIDEHILQMHYKQSHGTLLPDIDISGWKLSDYCEEAADLEEVSIVPVNKKQFELELVIL
nr:unnamed protein product [Callosobruchus analis]